MAAQKQAFVGTAFAEPSPKIATVGVATSQTINEWDEPMVMVDGFPIDAAVTEDHAYDNEVTDFPVEKGADITDHVRPKPLRITMEGFISGTPIGNVASHATRQGGLLPVDNGLAKLIGLRDNPEPVTVTTSLATYQSMILSTLSIPREPGEAYQIHFKATFVQVIIITNNRTTVRTATPGGQAMQQVGQQLAKLGIPFASVFTVAKDGLYLPPGATVANGQGAKYHAKTDPILTDATGSHYTIYDGSPASDGYVINENKAGIKPGYHSWYENLGVRWNASNGHYLNSKGQSVLVDPSFDKGNQVRTSDQASKDQQYQTTNLISDPTYQQASDNALSSIKGSSDL